MRDAGSTNGRDMACPQHMPATRETAPRRRPRRLTHRRHACKLQEKEKPKVADEGMPPSASRRRRAHASQMVVRRARGRGIHGRRRHGRAGAGSAQDRRHRSAVGRRHRLGPGGPARHGDRDRGDQCGRWLQGRRQDLQARAHHVRRPVHRRRRQGRGRAAGQPGQCQVHHRPGRLAAGAGRHQRHQPGQGHRADQRLRAADPEERHQGSLQFPHLSDQHRVRAAAHQVAEGQRARDQEGRPCWRPTTRSASRSPARWPRTTASRASRWCSTCSSAASRSSRR